MVVVERRKSRSHALRYQADPLPGRQADKRSLVVRAKCISMCGRYTNQYSWAELKELYDLTTPYLTSNFEPRYNIAPNAEMFGRAAE